MRQNVFMQLFAAVLRTVFPQLAVKYFTKKTNRNAVLFLPCVEKQLKAIEKLGLKAEELQERVWSLQTKVALLQQKRYDLVSEIRTAQEFDVLVNSGRVSLIVQAMKVYTPTQETALKLLDQFGLDAVAFINSAPAAFDGLKACSILGVEPEKACAPDSQRWIFAKALAAARSGWAVKFMTEVQNIVPQNLGDAGRENFEFFFQKAYEKQENMASLMPYMYVFFPELYAYVRKNYAKYTDFYSYISIMLPQLMKHLERGKGNFTDLSQVSVAGPVDNLFDAYAWLRIGYERMNEPAVYKLIISKMDELKTSVSEPIYNQLLNRLIRLASSPADVKRLLDMADDNKCQQRLYQEMAERSYVGLLIEQYPFSNWEDSKLVKQALSALINRNMFPVDRMAELPEDLQNFANYQMEVLAQYSALDADTLACVSYQLLPEAEMYLMHLEPRYNLKYQKLYVDKFKMSEKAFNYLIHREQRSLQGVMLFPDILVEQYAAKWGLTDAQYAAILQTPMKKYTLQWKKFVRKNEVSRVYNNETEG